MRIGGGGSDDANILLTDDVTRRYYDKATSDGKCFMGGAVLAPGGGNYPYIQLYNAASSGVVCFLDGIIASVSTAGTIEVGNYAALLTTDEGAGQNLLMGGTAAVCHVRSQASAAQAGTMTPLTTVDVNIPVPLFFERPFMVPEGQSFLVSMTSPAITLRTWLLWREYTS